MSASGRYLRVVEKPPVRAAERRAQLEGLCAAFARRRAALIRGAAAGGVEHGEEVAHAFLIWLDARGLDAHLVTASGRQGQAGELADGVAVSRTLVRLEDYYVDWAARLHDPAAPHPLIATEAELRQLWQHLNGRG